MDYLATVWYKFENIRNSIKSILFPDQGSIILITLLPTMYYITTEVLFYCRFFIPSHQLASSFLEVKTAKIQHLARDSRQFCSGNKHP